MATTQITPSSVAEKTESQSDAGTSASVENDPILLKLKASLTKESGNDWKVASLFGEAKTKVRKSYEWLADKAVEWGHRRYNRTYVAAIVATAEFFADQKLAKPFSWHVEACRAKNSLLKQCEDASIAVPTLTASDVLEAIKSVNKRSKMFETLKAKFAPTLPEKEQTTVPPIDPLVGTLPLWMIEPNPFEAHEPSGYRILVAAATEAKAREIVGATRKKSRVDFKPMPVGNISVKKACMLVMVMPPRGATTADIADMAKTINDQVFLDE